MTQTIAQPSESELRVVHAIPGRVRLRTTQSNVVPDLDKVAQQLRKQNGVCEVRTNSTTQSLVVTFDESSLCLTQALDLLQMTGVSQVSGNQEPLPELKLETFLRSQTEPPWKPGNVSRSLIPLVSGMIVTGALGLEGLIAFPVFLVTENVARLVIKQFDPEMQEAATVPPSQEVTTELNGKSAIVVSNNQAKVPHSDIECKLVHKIPGRMRFRVPQIAKDEEYTQKLIALLQADANVTDIRINPAASSIAISYNARTVSEEEIDSYLVELIQTANKINIPIPLKTSEKEQENQAEFNLLLQFGLPTLSATLALLGGPLGVPIPPIVIGGTIALSALPVAQRAIEGIVTEKRLTIDFLDITAITITTLQSQFISPSIMILLVEIGEAIREQTAKSSKLQTLDLLDSLNQNVWVERDGQKQEISIKEVRPGDIVIVYPGDQIPVDGHIIRGKALIDEQKLTGEAMPVMRHKGQPVYTSTLVREGQLYIQAEKVGAETRAGQIIKIMQDAPVHDTRIENYAATIANQAVVPTLLLSGIVFAFTGNFARAASVLTLDLATGIRVSVPTTVLAALTYAARRGILIRSGRALEKLAEVDAVVFDKTGTLTQGEPMVVCVESVSDSMSAMRVLELAAAAEKRLTHPVADAIVRHAQKQGVKNLPRGEWDYHIGLGVRAEIDGETVLVGSDRFLLQDGINVEQIEQKQSLTSSSIIYVASNGEFVGWIAYRDPLRAESSAVIQELQATAKMDIHLLTGDKKRTAMAVAGELGIEPENTHAEAFPEDKVAVVKNLHDGGKTVAFVGDGINDSPALAYADVSVSFANGSDVARETADVVLMENNLLGLPEAIAIARQALQLIHQNTGIVAVPNLGALILAVAVGIDPLAATLVNNGTTVVAGINGLRPLLTHQEEVETLTPHPQEDSSSFLTIEDVEPPIRDENSKSVDQDSPSCQEAEAVSPQPTYAEPHQSSVQSSETSTELATFIMSELTNGNNGNGVKTKKHFIQNGSRTPKKHREPLNAVALANRLNVSTTTISRRKSKPDFPEWSAQKDPHGIVWTYSKQSRLFMAG